MDPIEANIKHQQGDLWEVSWKIAANLTGHACRFAVMNGTTAVLTRLTSNQTMTLTYDAVETITAIVDGVSVTETGVTTLSPVLTLAESAALTPGIYDYEIEDLVGNTYSKGKCTVNPEISK